MAIRTHLRIGRRGVVGEAGFTLVELGVGMLVMALLSTITMTWVFAGFGSDSAHLSYDESLSELRQVADRMSREVRSAGNLTAAESTSMTFWLDDDRDGTVDAGELVTWTIGSDGSVSRATDGGPAATILATNLVQANSSFTYDALVPADVTRVTADLVAGVETRGGTDEISHSFDVYLRNM